MVIALLVRCLLAESPIGENGFTRRGLL